MAVLPNGKALCCLALSHAPHQKKAMSRMADPSEMNTHTQGMLVHHASLEGGGSWHTTLGSPFTDRLTSS